MRKYGITQDPETKNYMVVLSDKCEKCNKICNAIHFIRNFTNWTSGNNDIDKFIQDAQLSNHNYYEVSKALEWIPFNRFSNVSYNEFSEVYNANWVDGSLQKWDNKNQNWLRSDQNMVITLKSLDYSKDITTEFMNKA